MGQKVNPNSLRFGINKNWVSRWNAPNKKLRIKWLLEDEKARKLIKEQCKPCGVGLIEIERFLNANEAVTVKIIIHLSQIGLFLSNTKDVSLLNKNLKKIFGKGVNVNVTPVVLENPAVCADLVCQEISDAIQNRLPHRFVIKRLIKRTMGSGAEGIKVNISGRINGVEIARSESYVDGSVPLSTLRADIDYSFQIAKTSYGIIGVKVWINRGLYFGKKFMPLPPSPKNISWRTKNTTPKDNKYVSTTY